MSFYLKKYMWLISLTAVVFCSYFLARMTTDIVATKLQGEVPLPSLQQPSGRANSSKEPEKSNQMDNFNQAMGFTEIDDFRPITERNIFDSRAVSTPAPGDKKQEAEGIPVDLNGEAVLTTLSIKLLSTFAVGEGTDKRSSCVIAGGGKDEEVYTVHDEKKFATDTTIVKILYDRVEFVNKGRLEYVPLLDFTKGSVATLSSTKPPNDKGDKEVTQPKVEQAGEGKYVIDRSELDEAITNLDKLYSQIRVVPHFKDGNPDGLKILSVRSGSIFSKLGLQRGDILKKINGVELDIKKGLEIFNQLKSESHIVMDLDRRGTATTFDYEIR